MVTLTCIHANGIYEFGATILSFDNGYKKLTDAAYKALVDVDPERWQRLLDRGEIIALKDGQKVINRALNIQVRRTDSATAQPSGVPVWPRQGTQKPPEEPADEPTPVIGAPPETGKLSKDQEAAPAPPVEAPKEKQKGRTRKQPTG